MGIFSLRVMGNKTHFPFCFPYDVIIWVYMEQTLQNKSSLAVIVSKKMERWKKQVRIAGVFAEVVGGAWMLFAIPLYFLKNFAIIYYLSNPSLEYDITHLIFSLALGYVLYSLGNRIKEVDDVYTKHHLQVLFSVSALSAIGGSILLILFSLYLALALKALNNLYKIEAFRTALVPHKKKLSKKHWMVFFIIFAALIVGSNYADKTIICRKEITKEQLVSCNNTKFCYLPQVAWCR